MKFYELSVYERGNKGTRAFPTFGYPTKKVKCNACNREWNDFKSIVDQNETFPITFTNNCFRDFLSCEAFIMISHSAKNFIEQNKISSAIFVDAPVVSKSELTQVQLKERQEMGFVTKKFHDEKPTYYRLSAKVDAKLHPDSNVVWVNEGKYVCRFCGYGVGYKRQDYNAPYYIELRSWGGSDLFKVKEFDLNLFCTEKFKRLCEEANFSGIRFNEIEGI